MKKWKTLRKFAQVTNNPTEEDLDRELEENIAHPDYDTSDIADYDDLDIYSEGWQQRFVDKISSMSADEADEYGGKMIDLLQEESLEQDFIMMELIKKSYPNLPEE